MSFYLGCAVWAYRGWVGNFYPSGTGTSHFLRLYGQRLTAVEGNTTFYSIPAPDMVARWASETPEGFKFCPKLPKAFTHQGRLQPAIASTSRFVELMQGLVTGPDGTDETSRLGAIFAQLPPSYSPDQIDDLRLFLEAWPTGQARLAIEVRHPDWFQEPHTQQLNALLQAHGVGRVLLDTRPIYAFDDDPKVASERRKPQLPLQVLTTAEFALVRFIGHPVLENNLPFLEEWVSRVNEWLTQGITVYFFVHCPEEVRSPELARRFQFLLEQAKVPVPPLPWNLLPPLESITQFPAGEQLSLF